MILYHATKARLIDDIKKKGLSIKRQKEHEDNKFVHFATDINTAKNHVRNIGEKHENDKIMILALSSKALDIKDLASKQDLILYKGNISPELLFAVNCKTKSAEPLVAVNEFTPEYHYDSY